MNDTLKKVTDWIKAHALLSVVVLFVVALVFFKRKVFSLLGLHRRIRHRRTRFKYLSRRGGYRHLVRSRKALPRSVGVHKSRSGYPAAGGGHIPFKYNKDGSVKKAWQVGGTLAARSRMHRLRRARA